MSAALEVSNLSVEFATRAGTIRVVDDVSFALDRGEVVGLVGESGSGKSVTGLALMGLLRPPGRIAAGSVKLEGRELVGCDHGELRRLRGRRIAMIFQDPSTTLNPVLRIDTQILEAIAAHERVSASAARARATEVLSKVGIPSPAERLLDYPHQLSGGMRQRIAIAIALLHSPAVLIADEPTTALDVTIQAQVLAQAQALAREMGTAMLWVTHDLAVVAGLADRIAVMYAGRIVEQGSTADILSDPRHPYTAALLGCLPKRNRRGMPLTAIPGMMPSPAALPPGCAFAPRCPRAAADCRILPPPMERGAVRGWACFHPITAAELETVAP